MGVGSDGINEGEDASGIVHEYGHAVLGEQAPALFDSAEGGAYHEGFGDLLAYFVTLERPHRRPGLPLPAGPSRSSACAASTPTSSTPMTSSTRSTPTAMIYTGAIWDIFEGLLADDGLDIEDCPGTDDCAESPRPGPGHAARPPTATSPGPATLPDVAAAYVLGQRGRLRRRGRGADHRGVRRPRPGRRWWRDDGPRRWPARARAGRARGRPSRSPTPTGVTSTWPSGSSTPTATTCASRSACTTPDQNDGEDNLTGLADVSDTDCAELMPPSGDQQWYLQAVDTLAEDTGQIDSLHGLRRRGSLRGRRPAAAHHRQRPGRHRPSSSTAAARPRTPRTCPTTPSGDGPSFDLEISHSYVGDLSIRAGTADNDGGNVLCSRRRPRPGPGQRR